MSRTDRQKNAAADRRFFVLRLTDWKCAYCGGAATCVDHMTPLSREGEDTIANLIGACETCNLQKTNKTIEEYRWWVRFQCSDMEYQFFIDHVDPVKRDWLLVYSDKHAKDLATHQAAR